MQWMDAHAHHSAEPFVASSERRPAHAGQRLVQRPALAILRAGTAPPMAAVDQNPGQVCDAKRTQMTPSVTQLAAQVAKR
jgi:hypothetical protein